MAGDAGGGELSRCGGCDAMRCDAQRCGAVDGARDDRRMDGNRPTVRAWAFGVSDERGGRVPGWREKGVESTLQPHLASLFRPTHVLRRRRCNSPRVRLVLLVAVAAEGRRSGTDGAAEGGWKGKVEGGRERGKEGENSDTKAGRSLRPGAKLCKRFALLSLRREGKKPASEQNLPVCFCFWLAVDAAAAAAATATEAPDVCLHNISTRYIQYSPVQLEVIRAIPQDIVYGRAYPCHPPRHIRYGLQCSGDDGDGELQRYIPDYSINRVHGMDFPVYSIVPPACNFHSRPTLPRPATPPLAALLPHPAQTAEMLMTVLLLLMMMMAARRSGGRGKKRARLIINCRLDRPHRRPRPIPTRHSHYDVSAPLLLPCLLPRPLLDLLFSSSLVIIIARAAVSVRHGNPFHQSAPVHQRPY